MTIRMMQKTRLIKSGEYVKRKFPVGSVVLIGI